MKRICKCGCGEAFAPVTRNQQNIMGHYTRAERRETAQERAERRARTAERQAHAETAQRAAEQAAAERSPLTCPHRAVSACNHAVWRGVDRECMVQRSKCLCPLGFVVK